MQPAQIKDINEVTHGKNVLMLKPEDTDGNKWTNNSKISLPAEVLIMPF